MDLKNFTTTSIYAITAVYNSFWEMIPAKYKVAEDDMMLKDLSPFYDPELSFDNRLHYKLTNIDYPKRANPWFIITWNTGSGILRSSLTQRRFQSGRVEGQDGHPYTFDFLNVDMDMNLCIVCNTMVGLFELQENIYLKQRNKVMVEAKDHPIIGNFPVCLDILDSQQSKMSRDKGTLCYLMLMCKIDYPIICNVKDRTRDGGIIKTINYEINKLTESGDKHLILSQGQIIGESST